MQSSIAGVHCRIQSKLNAVSFQGSSKGLLKAQWQGLTGVSSRVTKGTASLSLHFQVEGYAFPKDHPNMPVFN